MKEKLLGGWPGDQPFPGGIFGGCREALRHFFGSLGARGTGLNTAGETGR